MSRIELAGQGFPIPTEALPDPGAGDTLPLTLILPNGSVFLKADYIIFGYTHYEITCVGGAGGKGGLTDMWGASYDFEVRSFGGAGGGGGMQVVAGELEALPDSCAVVSGAAGVAGADGVRGYNKTSATYSKYTRGLAGGNGGASSFGGTICRASGGKGGQPSQIDDETPSNKNSVREVWDGTKWIRDPLPGGNGGQGGNGGTTTVGGGGDGGIVIPGVRVPASGSHDNTPSSRTPPEDGIWDGAVGEGGGGGTGGTDAYRANYIMFGV